VGAEMFLHPTDWKTAARKNRTAASGSEFVRIPVNLSPLPKINQFFLLTGFWAFSGFITAKVQFCRAIEPARRRVKDDGLR
jgi:hypothetical protein